MKQTDASHIKALLREIEDRLDSISVPEISASAVPASETAMVMQARRILESRRIRGKFFDQDLFGEPAFDILLDVFVSDAGGRELSVGDICAAAGVPTTTAARQIRELCSRGLLIRRHDPLDGRRVFVQLAETTRRSLIDYLKLMTR